METGDRTRLPRVLVRRRSLFRSHTDRRCGRSRFRRIHGDAVRLNSPSVGRTVPIALILPMYAGTPRKGFLCNEFAPAVTIPRMKAPGTMSDRSCPLLLLWMPAIG